MKNVIFCHRYPSYIRRVDFNQTSTVDARLLRITPVKSLQSGLKAIVIAFAGKNKKADRIEFSR